jgi:hypothetical protein
VPNSTRKDTEITSSHCPYYRRWVPTASNVNQLNAQGWWPLLRPWMTSILETEVPSPRCVVSSIIFPSNYLLMGYAVAQLVEALRYKPEGRRFDSRWSHWNFSLSYSFRPHCGPGSTQPLTEMGTRNPSWASRRPVRRADNLTTFMCRLSRNSRSLNLLEPQGPVLACSGQALPLPFTTC